MDDFIKNIYNSMMTDVRQNNINDHNGSINNLLERLVD